MAIGPAFRGARQIFRLRPGPGSQQLPFPELVELPKLAPPVPQRPLPTRQAEPLAPDPRDVLRRPSALEREADDLAARLVDQSPDDYLLPVRTHQSPYEVIDPVSGQKVSFVWELTGPRRIQQDMLVEAAERGSANEVFAFVINSMRRAETPEQLYPTLVHLNNLRQRFGRQASSSGRIAKGSAGEEGGTAGVRSLGYGGSDTGSQISDVIESAIDNEVWRAAYRVGIPESELGQWADAFKALDIKGLGGRAQKTPLMELRNKITNIRKRKNETPEQISKNLAELDAITAPNGPMTKGDFSPRDIDIIFEQVAYAQDAIGVDNIGLRFASRMIGAGLPEDKLHAVMASAMKSAKNNDEVFAINALAKDNIKSIVFLDDIEDIGLQRVAEIIRKRKRGDDPSTIGRVAVRETPDERWARRFEEPRTRASYPQNEASIGKPWALRTRDKRGRQTTWDSSTLEPDAMGMRYTPGPQAIAADRIFGTFQNQGLFDTLGSTTWNQFGRGRNFRSFEVYDPSFKRPVHVVESWNNSTKKWEEVARNPVRPGRSWEGIPEYDWIGDPKGGMAVRAPKVEYQNFFYRISQPAEAAAEPLPPLDRLREALTRQRVSYGLQGNAKKVSDEVVELVAKMVSDGDLVPGTAQYNWMHTVFGRIALNIQGPGVRVGPTGLVSRDANAGRRIASMKAFEEADSIGLVPAEAAVYLRSIAPAEDAYETARATARASRPTSKPRTRATKKADDPDLTTEQELSILRQLLERERARSSAQA